MAEVKTLVNAFGKMAGWNSVTVNLFGRDVEGITEVSYDDNVEKEVVRGAGKMPIGWSEGNYEAKCAMVLYMEEVTAILDSLPTGKRIQDAAPVDIPVLYEYEGRVYKDIIRQFQITKIGKAVKQGDKTVGKVVECFCTSIDWNVKS